MSKIPTPSSTAENYIFLYDKPFKTGISFIGEIDPPMHLFFLVICPMVLYILCLYVIFPALKPKSKSAILFCDKWRYYHNVFMSLYSLGTFLLTVRELVIADDNEIGFVYSLSPKAWAPMMCNKPSELMYWINGVFIVSKIVEWIDSAFIIWLKNDDARAILKAAKEEQQKTSGSGKKSDAAAAAAAADNKLTERKSSVVESKKSSSGGDKNSAELSFLHGYHHMTTLFAFILVLNNPGGVKLGPLLNGFVHFLMYWHYARPLPRVVVPFITISQILQFFLVMYLWWVASSECADFAQLVKNHPWEYRTPFLFTPVYLVFFVKYFVKRWILPLIFGSKKSNAKEIKAE